LANWLASTAFSQTVQTVSWIIPLLQSIHILMIGVVFVSALMIALRVLGQVRADQPFDLVWKRFAPWMWTAIAIMAVTGLTLVVGEPEREFTALSFWIKMSLLVIGITSTVVYGRAVRAAAPAGSAAEFSLAARAGSVFIVVLWLAVIFLGRAIAYDKEVWGSLSLHA
jgi:uncharacterized membrane protein